MAIISYHVLFPSQLEDVKPRLARLYTNNTNAQVATAGFVNPYILSQGYSFEVGDLVFVQASDGSHIYTVSKSAGVVTLTLLV